MIPFIGIMNVSIGILIPFIGIMNVSIGILIASVGILIHWYFEHWYFERWYFESLPVKQQSRITALVVKLVQLTKLPLLAARLVHLHDLITKSERNFAFCSFYSPPSSCPTV